MCIRVFTYLNITSAIPHLYLKLSQFFLAQNGHSDRQDHPLEEAVLLYNGAVDDDKNIGAPFLRS